MTTILLRPETIECTEQEMALRSSEASPVQHVKHLAQRPPRRWRLGWNTLSKWELVWVRYQRSLVGGQGGSFDWTPPGFASPITGRFVGPLEVRMQTALGITAELEIEETRPGS